MFDDLRPELSIYDRSHMITPNFERLAKRSVVFDYAFAQIAVCNPSRDSLLTGLRPDTVGTYNFQHSYHPNIIFPAQLARSGYNTAGVGKIIHWEGDDRNVWNFDSWHNNWYDYQNYEWSLMNASTLPDKTRPEEFFRDYLFTNKAIELLKTMTSKPQFFMLGVGFKLPHLTVHVPYKYYEMYKARSDGWKLSRKELRFPSTSNEISYRCCAELFFRFMREEGSLPFNRTAPMGDINNAFTDLMHDELMSGYCAAVTFVDKQLGRILDVLDELDLWKNLTVVLTADHGMHNGEKGMWEKWTLFEESTRVPLLIAHPKSPFHGQHYSQPVELIDIYPTIMDLLKVPFHRKKVCVGGTQCLKLNGKSLAPVILGEEIWKANFHHRKHRQPMFIIIKDNPHYKAVNATIYYDSRLSNNHSTPSRSIMPTMIHNFALTQTPRCAPRKSIHYPSGNPPVHTTSLIALRFTSAKPPRLAARPFASRLGLLAIHLRGVM